MSEQFKVGTICIGQGYMIDIDKNGLECTIIRGLEARMSRNVIEGVRKILCYQVQWANGQVWNVKPKNLRRKPPQQDLTAWAASKVKDITKPVNVPDQVPA